MPFSGRREDRAFHQFLIFMVVKYFKDELNLGPRQLVDYVFRFSSSKSIAMNFLSIFRQLHQKFNFWQFYPYENFDFFPSTHANYQKNSFVDINLQKFSMALFCLKFSLFFDNRQNKTGQTLRYSKNFVLNSNISKTNGRIDLGFLFWVE